MSKTTILSAILSTCALAFAGCMTEADDELAPELGEVESALEFQQAPLCPDLLNVYTETLQSCFLNGQLGTKTCHQTCDIDRAIAFTTSGTTCRTVSTTCTPLVCGPCQVFTTQGPLP